MNASLRTGPARVSLAGGERLVQILDQILDILAAVNENPEEPFQAIEPELMASLAQITTVICVFLDWNPARRAFARNLASLGCGVRVIIVRDGDCTEDPSPDVDIIGPSPMVTREFYEAGLEQL